MQAQASKTEARRSRSSKKDPKPGTPSKPARAGSSSKGAAKRNAPAAKKAKAGKDAAAATNEVGTPIDKKGRIAKGYYEKRLERLSDELVMLQAWVKQKGLRVLVLFEGRDAAGKGGVIKTISAPLNPRGCRVVALGTPTEREKGQWYFQRYVSHLPAAGEIVLFDRSWYNRAGVERVMGFCTKEQYEEFLESCPEFERMLVRSGIILIKYWFSVSDDEQEKRFRDRADTPTKRWKISPMDLEARARWVDFSRAKDAMFDRTDNSDAPWWVVEADDKRRARLNCIHHLLSQVPYEDVLPRDRLKFPPRQKNKGYLRPPREKQRFVPERY
jgi:polyphosphate kinase 2